MSFSAKERTVQPTSQATPLSQDWVAFLQSMMGGGAQDPSKQAQGQLDRGAFGMGLTPLQQEAGTHARQYLEMGGGPEFQFDPLVSQLTDIFRRETERGAAQVREGMGTLGQRFGTPLAREEGRFRRESETDFLANLGEMFRQSFETRQNRYLQSMQLAQQMGMQNIAPFERMAGMGVFPTQTMYERPGGMQAMDWVTTAAGGGGGSPWMTQSGGEGGGGGGGQEFQWSPASFGTPT